MQQALNLNV